MHKRRLRCGILGAQERDLAVLSELHRQPDVEVAFVYDTHEGAVGLEIAEILGLPRFHKPDQLKDLRKIDHVVVSEPRARFSEELTALTGSGAKVLTPSAATTSLCASTPPAPPEARDIDTPYTVEDTLQALEKLLDRKQLLKFLLEVAVRATSSSAGSVMLYSTEAKELYIAYATGLSERIVKNTRQKLGEGVAGAVALRKEAQLLTTTSDRSLYARDRERLDIASAISVPLMWEGRLLGVVNVSSGKKGHVHDEHDLTRLKELSRRLSRVLFESLKLQETQMRHREAKIRSTMGEVAVKPVSTVEKFSIVCRYLSELLGAETVEVFMHTAEGDWFILGGSNRLLTPRSERLRFQKGTLSRAFLERRCIVLTESADPTADALEALSSSVYCHLGVDDSGGVLVLEFKERYRLDEFLIIREAIELELARFMFSEMRERKLKRELDAFSKVSDAAATLLGCRTVDELADVLGRVVADVLECRQVSVRLRPSADDLAYHVSLLEPPGEPDAAWADEDSKRFERLVETGKAFTLALLDFDAEVREDGGGCASLLASPIAGKEAFHGGIIAYGKQPGDPMEDVVFSDLDRNILENLARLILPVLDTIQQTSPGAADAEPDAYETVLESNLTRFQKVCVSEISRSDRYHHSFALILFRINPLDELFDDDYKAAFGLVDEITQGIRTRTRETDYGAWVDRATYAMLSLEGGRRIRFLLSRVVLYLMKDLSGVEDLKVGKNDILVGSAVYPGASRTAAELLAEAEKDLQVPSQE
ncbi:MAG: GAF domain-containing protein [Candidatus Krumholzibacteriia bacterium]